MPRILRKLPFADAPGVVSIPGGPVVAVKPLQIIVWVGLTEAGLPECPPHARRFPAILDTGFNSTFLIQEQHFTAWAGLSPQDFDVLGFLTAYGQQVPLIGADLWLHRNQPGHRDQFLSEPPFRIEWSSGIGICPAPMNAPRLPLLGLLALRLANLKLFIDCDRCRADLRTPWQLWFLGRW